jgi:homoserine O-acetyltransferase
MIVFENAKPKKSAYKKFKIKSFLGQDDYGSMEEVLTRRFEEYNKAKNCDDDIDEGLNVIPDGTYDLAVLSETLQAVKRPQELLRRILRIADEAVVSFPNFAELSVRIQLGLKGRMPKGKQLPFEWYNTPNIHLFTLKDFKALCKSEEIEIKEIRSEARSAFGRILLALGFANIGASRVTARIAKKNKEKITE